MLAALDLLEGMIGQGDVLAASTPGYGCAAESLFTMCLGNRLGIELSADIDADSLFKPAYGSFIVELGADAKVPAGDEALQVCELGRTTGSYEFAAAGERIDLEDLQEAWESALESVFPY